MSLARLRPRSVAASAIEYASVTEQVALGVARLEGAGVPEKAYTLATEVFREELGKVGVSGQVAILREERLDERGQVRSLKTRPGILSAGDVLGAGEVEVDLAVEPVEGLHLLTKGQPGAISAGAARGPHRGDKGDRGAYPDPTRRRSHAGRSRGAGGIRTARGNRDRGGTRGDIGRRGDKVSWGRDPGKDVAHPAFAGRKAQRVRPRRPGEEARPGRSHTGRRRYLRGDRHHDRGDPVRGQVLPGWRPDAHGGYVHGATYGTIYGRHPRPRTRRREAGLPVLGKH